VTIAPHYRSIKDLLQTRSFSIDEYQREHKWETHNIQELLSDLQARFEGSYRDGDSPPAASTYADYFLGSIIVTARGDKSYLVDGQQRVTSLTLLLIHLYREAKDRGFNAASTIEPLIFSDDYGVQKFNLDIAERLAVIRALFRGEAYSPDGKDESVQTILARYEDIEDHDLANELGDGLETFIYWLIHKVGLIEIVADSDTQAYSIFETMNDRGKPLSPVDMLKAYLLAPIQDEATRADANRIWKKNVHDLLAWGDEPNAERDAAMVKAWLRSQHAETIRDRKSGAVDKDWELIGTSFHRWLRDNASRVGVGDEGSNLEMMTEAFPHYGAAYRTILAASTTYTPGLEPVFYNAHTGFTWQSTVLMAPLAVDDDAETVRKKIAATATYVDIWVMRRAVNYVRVGYSSVSYAMFLLCRDIREKSLPDLVSTLKDKLGDDDASFDAYRARGRTGIADLSINQFSGRYIFHLLARLTAYVEAQSGKPDLFDKYVDRKAKNPRTLSTSPPTSTRSSVPSSRTRMTSRPGATGSVGCSYSPQT
jgi:uncharacterized protein with ParB-like and HNH nuclease domain